MINTNLLHKKMNNTVPQLSIIHCDMDAFFAAIEQRDHPELKGKPVIVGGAPRSRGVVSTCSYEARAYGVRSAMPLTQAHQLCPNGIFLPVNMSHYLDVSQAIMDIFYSYTPAVEILSIDEAFLDVRGCEGIFGSVPEIGKQIKARIKQELNLTASVGISYNKFLAKLGSELNKPDGFKIILPEHTLEILAPLPINYIWGVGPKTAHQFNKLGIRTIGDLQNTSEDVLKSHFKNAGKQYYLLAHGIDERPIEIDRQRQSMGREYTFTSDTNDIDILEQILYAFTDELSYRLRRVEMKTTRVNVKIRYENFKTINRSHSLAATDLSTKIANMAIMILKKAYDPSKKVRLIGLSLENLLTPDTLSQASLFIDADDEKSQKLDLVLDAMRKRFGNDVVKRAGNISSPNENLDK